MKKPLAIWKVIGLDLFILAVALCVFALFHHVIPQPSKGLGIVSNIPGVTNEEKDESKDGASVIDELKEKGALLLASTTSDITKPALEEEVSVNITEHSYLNGSVTYYLADIKLSDPLLLKTYFANDSYGRGFTESVPAMAHQINALLAVNGDYYGNSNSGVVARNGVIYRANYTDADILLMYADGSMKITSFKDFDVQNEAEKGLWQAWTFGPSLLDENGKALTNFNVGRHLNNKNPRTVLGYYESGHYAILVVDGRGDSDGLSLNNLSRLCEEIGFKVAYNLDGGKSSVLVYENELVNEPANGGRTISDIIYIGGDSL